MKQQLINTEGSVTTVKQTAHNLYNAYGGMLLGYIREVIKDPALAEQFLTEVFTELTLPEMMVITDPSGNTFCRLQMLARKKLAAYINSVGSCAGDPAREMAGNKFIGMMSAQQKLVFCGVHYHGKSIAALAAELQQPEAIIRKLLKDSFTIIRTYRNDTGLH